MENIKHTRTKENSCPKCNSKIDSISDSSNKDLTPMPGDLSICFNCACILILKEDLTVRSITKDELDKLDKETVDRLACVQLSIVVRKNNKVRFIGPN